MMVFTTMFIAVVVLALLWFIILQRLPWPLAGYAVVAIAGVACFLFGSVHFVYIGVEILGFGGLLVWLRHRFGPPVRRPKPVSSGSGAPPVA